MATQAIHDRLRKDITFVELLGNLKDVQIDGATIKLEVDHRALPYLDHTVVGFTDGPMATKVEAVFSGKDPDAEKWRRFTLQREGYRHYRLMAFPTPFNNDIAPLSPGIPPSASRAAHH
ncbi:MAG: hypothetical protein H6739_40630 [Alphaproteobacteria bacterium]|nr:hypothetical protein [Alphaproteobacteria bacterium]